MSLGFVLIRIERKKGKGKKWFKKYLYKRRSVSRSLGSELARNLQGLVESRLSGFSSSYKFMYSFIQQLLAECLFCDRYRSLMPSTTLYTTPSWAPKVHCLMQFSPRQIYSDNLIAFISFRFNMSGVCVS